MDLEPGKLANKKWSITSASRMRTMVRMLGVLVQSGRRNQVVLQGICHDRVDEFTVLQIFIRMDDHFPVHFRRVPLGPTRITVRFVLVFFVDQNPDPFTHETPRDLFRDLLLLGHHLVKSFLSANPVHQLKIDASELAAGIYLLKVYNAHEAATAKIIIQKK